MAKRPTTVKRLPAAFFENEAGRMPVREWLMSLTDEDRKAIGDDIRTAEFGWPLECHFAVRSSDVKVYGKSAAV